MDPPDPKKSKDGVNDKSTSAESTPKNEQPRLSKQELIANEPSSAENGSAGLAAQKPEAAASSLEAPSDKDKSDQSDDLQQEPEFGINLDEDSSEGNSPPSTPEESDSEDDLELDDVYNYDEVGAEDKKRLAIEKAYIEGRTRTIHQELSPGMILQSFHELIRTTSEMLNFEESTTCSLLQKFQWRKQQLLDEYFKASENDPDGTSHLQLLGTTHEHDARDQDPVAPGADGNLQACQMCMDPILANEDMITSTCPHLSCNSCWIGFMKSKIGRGYGLQLICPARECDQILNWLNVSAFMTRNLDPNVNEKYRQLVVNEFIQMSSNLMWCRASGCDKIIQVPCRRPAKVTCSCGLSICVSCEAEWHEPLTCQLMERWTNEVTRSLNDEAAANAGWFAANVKKCPRCAVPIQKDGGCTIMACRNLSCGTSFCWICLQDNVTHSTPHSCSVWTAIESQDPGQNLGELLLARQAACRGRYMGHMESSKAEHRLTAKIEIAISRFRTAEGRSLQELQTLKTAEAQLKEGRRLLMNACGFLHYLDLVGSTDHHFNHLNERVQDFESGVERISWILENFLQLPFGELSAHLDLKTSNCEKSRISLLAMIYKGYDENWWTFIATTPVRAQDLDQGEGTGV